MVTGHSVTWWQLLAVDCCQTLSFIPFTALVSSEGQREPSFQSKTVRAEDPFSMHFKVGFLRLAGICLSELIAYHWEKWKALFLSHIIDKTVANSRSAKHLLVLLSEEPKASIFLTVTENNVCSTSFLSFSHHSCYNQCLDCCVHIPVLIHRSGIRHWKDGRTKHSIFQSWSTEMRQRATPVGLQHNSVCMVSLQ